MRKPRPHLTSPTLRAGEESFSLSHVGSVGEGWGEGRIWATASNAYFSQIVRIQTERGHTVASGGPYRCVRHPAYTGTILYELAVPVLLASAWSAVPSVLAAILLILRTVLEDRTLQSELVGYPENAHQAPYRLMPGIW